MLHYKEIYPKELSAALKTMGQYVYAYYRPDEIRPFYVGKGVNNRVMAHWDNAMKLKKNSRKDHENEIYNLLKNKTPPTIKILAYNLENSDEQPYSIVERVLQDTFGIQKVIVNRNGVERIEEIKDTASLLQIREDSNKYPALTLDAVIAKANLRDELNRSDLENLAMELDSPILLVGLSKTYHPTYTEKQLAEMARMYWPIKKKFGNTSLPFFETHPTPILLAWSSQLNNMPMIVGAWRLKPNSMISHDNFNREEFAIHAFTDFDLRRKCIGVRLRGSTGKGNDFQGQSIFPKKGEF